MTDDLREQFTWSALGNGTLLHIRANGPAGLLIAAAYEIDNGESGIEVALSVQGSSFGGEGIFSDLDAATDHVVEKIAYFDKQEGRSGSEPLARVVRWAYSWQVQRGNDVLFTGTYDQAMAYAREAAPTQDRIPVDTREDSEW